MERMQSDLEDEELYALALKRLNMKKHFLMSIVNYLAVNAFLAAIDLHYSGGTWFYYVLGIWGIVLLLQGVNTYTSLTYSHDEQVIKREINKLRNDKGGA